MLNIQAHVGIPSLLSASELGGSVVARFFSDKVAETPKNGYNFHFQAQMFQTCRLPSNMSKKKVIFLYHLSGPGIVRSLLA